jgi:hypothetical protein
VLLYRNVFQQWCSYTEQAVGGNNYFIDRLAETVRRSLHDSTLAELNALFPAENPSCDSSATFFLFLFLHLHIYTQSAGAADVIMDLNRMATDSSYRQAIEQRFAAEDVPIDFSGVGNTIAYSLCRLGPQAGVRERLKVLGDMIADRAPDPAGRAFATKVLDEFIEEYARYEFYAGGLRSLLIAGDASLAPRDAMPASRELVPARPGALVLTHATDEEPKRRRKKPKKNRAGKAGKG